MSQEALAAAAEVGRGATISDLEKGKGNPTMSTLEAIAAALGASLSELVSAPVSDDAMLIAKAFDALPASDKRKVQGLVGVMQAEQEADRPAPK